MDTAAINIFNFCGKSGLHTNTRH